MKKVLKFAVLIFLTGCASVPITHRKQLSLLPESSLMASSSLQYAEFLSQATVVNSANQQAQLVQSVGQKLADACTQFLNEHGGKERIKDYQWEFNLVDDPQANAWCMPGGKVVVYTGIMPICKNEEGLAVVLSHEIAHAIARHGNERMSQQVATQYGSAALETVFATSGFASPEMEAIFMQSYGMGSQLGILKFSRSHESEADKMGLVFMEYAGYDCSSAIDFWTRMQSGGGQKPPEILSTHPSDETRIADITAFISQAKSYKK